MKFLIVRLSSLGDIVHSLPLVYKLKQYFPDSEVDWLTSKSGFELLSLVSEVNNVYIANFKNILLIQGRKYDYVIDVQGLLKSAFLSKLSFGKKIIGFKGARELAPLFYDRKINAGDLFKTSRHVVDLNLELLFPIINNSNKTPIRFLIPRINESDNEDVLQVIYRKRSPETLPSVIVFPGTTWESKLWAMDSWYSLIKNLSKDFKIYLCGSKSDLRYISSLINKLDLSGVSYENLVSKTSIKDLIFLIHNSNLVIGMDSFGLHLASAIKNDFGYPQIIGIYGPTSPHRNGPYGRVQDCLYLSELECIACRKKKCPLGHHKCMNDIAPQDVMDKIYMLNSITW